MLRTTVSVAVSTTPIVCTMAAGSAAFSCPSRNTYRPSRLTIVLCGAVV